MPRRRALTYDANRDGAAEGRGPLDGLVAVVSGGLGGIGAATTSALMARGAAVAVCDIAAVADGDRAVAALQQHGGHCTYACVDVADRAAVDGWLDFVEQDLGPIYAAVPNAAVATFADPLSIPAETWHREFDVNVHGAWNVAAGAARRMAARGSVGRIVFVGSWVADRPQAGLPAYCASKAAVRAMMRLLAARMAPEGVLVNEVAPGNVDAGISAAFYARNPERRSQDAERIPVRSLATAAEVAEEIARLCEPGHAQATGSTILIDGGLSLVSYLG